MPPERDPRALYGQAFLHSSNAMEITDGTGKIVDVNPAFEKIYGYARDELIGQKPSVVRSPKTPLDVYQTMWKSLLDPGKGEWSGELTNLDKSGREHPVLLSISALRNAQGEITHFLGVATDLTDLKALQLQSIRNERLLSLGQLATSIAHELNTPLANIQLIAEGLERRAPNPWIAARSRAIQGQVEAAARIVAGLLDFGRNHPTVLKETDLVQLLREAVAFVRGKQTDDIDLRFDAVAASLPVRANRVQIIQVFVNILNNAYDALGGIGMIRIQCRASEDWAEVEIRDTGPGIAAEVMPHIFEPFFTTKQDGKGTGLGLAICHGIVRAHGGEIRVASEPAEGAAFTVRLPLAGADTGGPGRMEIPRASTGT